MATGKIKRVRVLCCGKMRLHKECFTKSDSEILQYCKDGYGCRIKYQILYMDTITYKNVYYLKGLSFYKENAEVEIKLLKEQQAYRKENGLKETKLHLRLKPIKLKTDGDCN